MMEKTIFLMIATTIFSWSTNRSSPKVAEKQATGNSTQVAHRLSFEHLLICKGYLCDHYCN